MVILSGDHPLVTPEHVTGMIRDHDTHDAEVTVLATDELDPTGYGRIVRDAGGHVERIVETKYTEGVPDEVLAIREVNLGTYVVEAPLLFEALDQVRARDQGERYLTEVIPVVTRAAAGWPRTPPPTPASPLA